MPGGGGWGCQSYELSGTEGPTNFGRINWVMSNYVSVQKNGDAERNTTAKGSMNWQRNQSTDTD